MESYNYIEWYQFKKPLTIILDGTTGMGEIYQPVNEKATLVMDEEESSGI